jgi:dienelactone hydrolase
VPEEAYSGNGGVSNSMIAAKNGKTSPALMTKAIDWVFAGNAAKYGTIDRSKVVAMGQSCGGIESYTASYHDDRVKQTILLNSGSGNTNKRCLFKELKAPVALFVGGPCDLANRNAISDYDTLTIEKFKAHIDSGHSGTYSDSNAGKYGKAVVSFLQWRLRDDQKAKALWADPKSPGSFASEGWYNITSSLFPHYESRSKYFNETYV